MIVLSDFTLVRNTKVEYARVESGAGQTPCRATGAGGWIEVTCDSATPGSLLVQENSWTGWIAWRDGVRVPVLADGWLKVEAAPGKHTYLFRYLPWDVPAGLLVTLVGVFLCARFWRPGRAKPSSQTPIGLDSSP